MTTNTKNNLETIFYMCFILPLCERMGWGLQTKQKITNNLQTKRQPSEKALKSSWWLDWSCVLFLSLLVVVLWICLWKSHLFEFHNFPPVSGFVFENISIFHLREDVGSMTQGRVECWGLFLTCLPRGRVWVKVQNWGIRKWKWCFPFLGSKQFLKYHCTIQILVMSKWKSLYLNNEKSSRK